MSGKLGEICAVKREYIAKLKAETSFTVLDKAARKAPPPRGFAAALRDRAEGKRIGLIAEIKKASPSADVIRPRFDPAEIAKAYEAGGAACLSVLTDGPYFQGCNDHLTAARAACRLPVLRKDFMLDVWQVAEARSIGADCILLIMAALDDVQAAELHAAAASYGMDVLIEAHDRAELERALRLPSGLIGINNRDLKTLAVNLETTEELALLIPKGRLAVSESGIKNSQDIARLRAAGISCFLVGESLLRQADVTAAVKSLTAA